METKLTRIAELAKNDPKMKFTSLAHHLDAECLKGSHHDLPGNKAAGIKGTTKAIYEENLEENIEALVYKNETEKLSSQPS